MNTRTNILIIYGKSGEKDVPSAEEIVRKANNSFGHDRYISHERPEWDEQCPCFRVKVTLKQWVA